MWGKSLPNRGSRERGNPGHAWCMPGLFEDKASVAIVEGGGLII